MNQLRLFQVSFLAFALAFVVGCDKPDSAVPATVSVAPAPWLGIPSAVNQVIVCLHDGTGWLLNKSEVSVKKTGEVRPVDSSSNDWVGDFEIRVHFGGETFETTAKDVPCDRDGIPTETAVDRLRMSVEDIKVKMKRLQN